MWGIQRLRFLHPVTGCSLHCLICELSFATQPSLNQEHRSRHKCWKHGFTSKVTQQILVDSWDRAFMQILVMSCQDPAIKQGRENTMNILKINEKIMTKQVCTATPLNLSKAHKPSPVTQGLVALCCADDPKPVTEARAKWVRKRKDMKRPPGAFRKMSWPRLSMKNLICSLEPSRFNRSDTLHSTWVMGQNWAPQNEMIKN